MLSFEYRCPTEIIFGKAAEDKTAEKIKAAAGFSSSMVVAV